MMAGSHMFMKARSLRYGSDDCWCDRAGRYRVGTGIPCEGFGTFFFHVRKKNRDGTVITLTCKSYRRSGCRVRAQIRRNGETVLLPGVHDHLPEKDGHSVEYREVRTRWINEIRNNPRKNPRDVILHQRSKLPNALASRIKPVQHVRTCIRHAGKVRPPKVESLSQLHEVISTEAFPGFNVTRDGHRLVSYFSQEYDSLLLTSETLLGMLSEAEVVHVHAPYKVVPRKLCSRLFTIHGKWGGRIAILACAFVNCPNSEAYRWIFARLKQAVPALSIPAYVDAWDQGMRKAVSREFPCVAVYGCFFHYHQSLVRKASDKKVGMAEEIRKPGEILSSFLALAAMPLLPSPSIEPTFCVLEARSRHLHAGFPALLDYVSSHWLHTVGPRNLSVHGLRQRTNNNVESCDSKLFRALGSHGPVWTLVSMLLDSAQNVGTNGMSRGTRIEHMVGSFDSWSLMENEDISAVEFIDRVKYKVGKKTHLRTLATLGISAPENRALREWLEQKSSYRYPDEDVASDSTISASEEEIEGTAGNGDDHSIVTATASEADYDGDEASVAAVPPRFLRDHTYVKRLDPTSISLCYQN